jgi:hypothetical protein
MIFSLTHLDCLRAKEVGSRPTSVLPPDSFSSHINPNLVDNLPVTNVQAEPKMSIPNRHSCDCTPPLSITAYNPQAGRYGGRRAFAAEQSHAQRRGRWGKTRLARPPSHWPQKCPMFATLSPSPGLPTLTSPPGAVAAFTAFDTWCCTPACLLQL